MMISTRGRYALRVMLDLATDETGTYVPLDTIARRQGISEKYLESILAALSRAGLVLALRGKGGGYKLSRKPEDYVIGEVLELMEGPLAPVACLTDTAVPCPRAAACETLPLWAEYDKLTHDFFYGKRLSDLLVKNQAPAAAP